MTSKLDDILQELDKNKEILRKSQPIANKLTNLLVNEFSFKKDDFNIQVAIGCDLITVRVRWEATGFAQGHYDDAGTVLKNSHFVFTLPETTPISTIYEIIKLVVGANRETWNTNSDFVNKFLHDLRNYHHVEMGQTHPAEKILEHGLVNNYDQTILEIKGIIKHNTTFNKDVCMIVGRMPQGLVNDTDLYEIVEFALTHEYPDTRDAGVYIIETMGLTGKYLILLEEAHQKETEQWLKDYMGVVIGYLKQC